MEKDLRACITVILKSNCDYKGKIMFDKVPIGSILYVKNSSGDIVKTIECKKSKMYWNGLSDSKKTLETGLYSISIKTKNSTTPQDNLLNFTVIK